MKTSVLSPNGTESGKFQGLLQTLDMLPGEGDSFERLEVSISQIPGHDRALLLLHRCSSMHQVAPPEKIAFRELFLASKRNPDEIEQPLAAAAHQGRVRGKENPGQPRPLQIASTGFGSLADTPAAPTQNSSRSANSLIDMQQPRDGWSLVRFFEALAPSLAAGVPPPRSGSSRPDSQHCAFIGFRRSRP